MKRIFVLPIVVGIVLGLCSYAYAVTPGITKYAVSSRTAMNLDALGNIFRSITRSPTTITITDVAGIETTKVQTQVVNAALHGGSLKTDSVETTIKSSTGDGTWSADGVWSGSGDWSITTYTDRYTYNSSTGVLEGVDGGGTIISSDAASKDYTVGILDRDFEVKNGQPVLLKQTINGTTWDDNTKAAKLSSYIQTTDYTNVVKDNGQVVTAKSVSSSTSYDKGGTVVTKTGKVTTDYNYAYLGGSYVVSSELETTHNQEPGKLCEDIVFETTYHRDAHGVLTNAGGGAITKNCTLGQRTVTDGNGGVTYYELTHGSSIAFDNQFGWYISEERPKWDLVVDPAWGEASGVNPPAVDPAATGTVYQDQVDGQWYMNVTCWTNKEKTEYKTVTITLDLSALSSQQRRDTEAILQQYASSKAPLTLFGFAAGEVLPDGATLTVIGLGNGPFDSHPYDFVGQKPSSLLVAELDFAEFTTMMNNTTSWSQQLFMGLSDLQRYTTYRELYTALMKGNLKIGGSITTSTGIQFRLEKQGNACRLEGKNASMNWRGMLIFTNHLSQQLGLL